MNVIFLKCQHYFCARFFRMQTVCFMLRCCESFEIIIHVMSIWIIWKILTFMNRSFPLAANSIKSAICWAFFTLRLFMMFKRFCWILLSTELQQNKILVLFPTQCYLAKLTWHSLGNSLTAFSTAKLREAVDLEISTRQLGHVATWSRSLFKWKSILINKNGKNKIIQFQYTSRLLINEWNKLHTLNVPFDTVKGKEKRSVGKLWNI